MLDLLEHYMYDSLPREDFATSPGLRRKVGPEGNCCPFTAARRSFGCRRRRAGRSRGCRRGYTPRRGACSRSRWSPGPST